VQRSRQQAGENPARDPAQGLQRPLRSPLACR
jgi:hypothetical protein